MFLSMSKQRKNHFAESCIAFCQPECINMQGDPQINLCLDENPESDAVSRDLHPCKGLRTKCSADLS
jgi:hypothetical protein